MRQTHYSLPELEAGMGFHSRTAVAVAVLVGVVSVTEEL